MVRAKASSAQAALAAYRRKRQFDRTPEPSGSGRKAAARKGLGYVIQKHAATRLHYDFRLELNGTLKSWAVPKGPSLDPADRRLAVQVEDHPVEYGGFEGTIPKGQYGGGTVMLWDRGQWEPLDDPEEGLRKGRLHFILHGERLQGAWNLVRIRGREGGDKNWLLIKERDAEARTDADASVIEEFETSVASRRSMEQIASANGKVWSSNREPAQTRWKPRIAASRSRAPRGAPARALKVDALANARKAAPPRVVEPQLATLVSVVPEGDDWLHEIKWDGYRLLCFLRDGRVRLMTRGVQDWTHRFPTIAQALSQLPLKTGILDGELVSIDSRGQSSFQELQNAIRSPGKGRLQLVLFDILHADGYDLQRTPLLERKGLLERVTRSIRDAQARKVLRFSEHVIGHGGKLLAEACHGELEGLVSKRVDSPYVSGRGRLWVKTKCSRRQEFVIGGFSEPEKSRVGFGSLLLGYYDGDDLIYSGRVGTGFDQDDLISLTRRLKQMERKQPAYAVGPQASERRGVHWVEPKLVAEVQFTQWTDDGRLRHPAFLGLREDKPAQEVVKEKPVPARNAASSKTRRAKSAAKPAGAVVAGVTITHPDRVLYAGTKVTKVALAEYLEFIAPRMLPYVENRPITLVRCPQGESKECFFQKHFNDVLPDTLREVRIQETRTAGRYIYLNDVAGLVTLAQWGTLEIHPWGSRVDDLEHPERIIFDLDPGPDMSWKSIVEAARTVRAVLEAAGLKSFVLLSGGKGLHVIAPIQPRHEWPAVKGFCKTVAMAMEREAPDRYVAVMTKTRRAGRVFVDYLRNGRGATSVSPWSTRARPGAPIATPVHWEELGRIRSASQFTVENIRRRLKTMKSDPWQDYFKLRQSLPKL